MALNVPPAVNYPSPLIAIPSRWAQKPVEGPKAISCEIDWATMGGSQDTVNFNLQNNATLAFSQIVALKVDNSNCGGDVQFIFPDTGDTVTIPALAAEVITPVFTNGQQFFVQGLGTDAADVTRFQVLNAMPPPLAIPRSTLQESAVVSNIPLTNGNTTLVGDGNTSLTIEGLVINGYTGTTVSATNYGLIFRDLASPFTNLLEFVLVATGTSSPIGPFIINPLNFRTNGGLDLNISGITTPGSGILTASVLYRTP